MTMRCSIIGLILALALGVLVVPRATEAQPPAKVYRIGVLAQGSAAAPGTMRFFEPFYQGLHDLGYVEGQHIVFERRYAEGHLDRLPALAAELVRLPVHLLFATGSAASVQAAKHATTTIPIVFAGVFDPVGHGFVASLARPGGNITGVAFDPRPEIEGKYLELLKAAVPTISRVAMLVGRERSSAEEALEQMWERVARELGLTLRYFYITRSEAITESVFPALTADVPPIDALYTGGGPPVFVYRRQIVDFARQHRLPLIGVQRPWAEGGALLSYGPTQREIQGRAAVLVDKILKGATPADLPVELPTKFELVINLKTAQALGLTIPPTLLFQADEVIR
jgi:putative tryptophan/tyrosine transport system substrate-binding protein